MNIFADFGRKGFMTAGIAAFGMAALAAPLALVSANAQEGVDMEQGRQLFEQWACGSCHVLTDANGSGHVGPSLDGNANLDKDYLVSRITNGQGAMPSFGGLMSDEEIGVLSDYILASAKD